MEGAPGQKGAPVRIVSRESRIEQAERERGRDRERESKRKRGDQAQKVVAGEGGACSMPEVGGVVRCPFAQRLTELPPRSPLFRRWREKSGGGPFLEEAPGQKGDIYIQICINIYKYVFHYIYIHNIQIFAYTFQKGAPAMTLSRASTSACDTPGLLEEPRRGPYLRTQHVYPFLAKRGPLCQKGAPVGTL